MSPYDYWYRLMPQEQQDKLILGYATQSAKKGGKCWVSFNTFTPPNSLAALKSWQADPHYETLGHSDEVAELVRGSLGYLPPLLVGDKR